MKKFFLVMLTCFSFTVTTYAQKYFGKNYTPTQQVDTYFDAEDVTIPYTVMGNAEMAQGFRSLDKVQEKLIKLAESKGADGIIFELKEEVVSSQQTGTGTVGKTKKKKNAVMTQSNTTYDIKQKKVKAKFIKYEKH